MESAEQQKVAVDIVGAFEVEKGGDFSGGGNAADVFRVESKFDPVVVLADLFERQFDGTERVLHFVAGGIVGLGRVDGEEHGVDAALAGAGQVDVAVSVAVADVEPLEQLPRHDVDVAVHDESVAVEGGGRLGEQWKGDEDGDGFHCGLARRFFPIVDRGVVKFALRGVDGLTGD